MLQRPAKSSCERHAGPAGSALAGRIVPVPAGVSSEGSAPVVASGCDATSVEAARIPFTMQFLRAVIDDRDTPPSVKLLLCALIRHARGDGTARPGMALLALEIGKSIRTVNRLVETARASGLLTIGKNKTDRGWCNCYKLTLPGVVPPVTHEDARARGVAPKHTRGCDKSDGGGVSETTGGCATGGMRRGLKRYVEEKGRREGDPDSFSETILKDLADNAAASFPFPLRPSAAKWIEIVREIAPRATPEELREGIADSAGRCGVSARTLGQAVLRIYKRRTAPSTPPAAPAPASDVSAEPCLCMRISSATSAKVSKILRSMMPKNVATIAPLRWIEAAAKPHRDLTDWDLEAAAVKLLGYVTKTGNDATAEMFAGFVAVCVESRMAGMSL